MAPVSKRAKPIRFIDTSAYLSWALGQPTTLKLDKIIAQATLAASTILFAEAERAFLHLARSNLLTHEQALSLREGLIEHARHFIVREPSLELCLNNRFPAMTTPKSADLIHLRTALWFLDNGGLNAFITTDKQQAIAAAEFGLPLL